MASAGTETLDLASLQGLLGPGLTSEQAALIFEQEREAVAFALLGLTKQLALKQRGRNPVAAVLNAMRASLHAGQRPPVPALTADPLETLWATDPVLNSD